MGLLTPAVPRVSASGTPSNRLPVSLIPFVSCLIGRLFPRSSNSGYRGLFPMYHALREVAFCADEAWLAVSPSGTEASSSSNSQSSTWSGSWIYRWLNPLQPSSAPIQPEGEVNQPQPPAAGPWEPIPGPAPIDSPQSLTHSNQEWLSAFFSEEGTTVEQEPGAPEAMPQAPATKIPIIKTSIIQRMRELYPKGSTKSPYKSFTIPRWDWEHPRSLPSFRNKVAVGKPAAGLNPLRTTNDLIQARKVRRQARSNRATSQLQCFSYIGNED
ncbi:hypothetical protein DEO72_LG10g1988 [Vigna unguiculata]|uniref:Uncharacterized protein n=1 Tax=Vigna unguiculata TaxID=3917 RepID=A0A4D6NAJ1_VIGUN|nr:hypothetical protein DEO72_LG10g1988 [Vigna unguiculata]